jgi:CotH kinase protein/Lamin Tail Domain/Chitobiase/beta-hexosaminidase C-terminal domain
VYFRWISLILACLPGIFTYAQQGSTGVLSVQFSQLGGHYKGGVEVLLNAQPGAVIHYTLDGARPNEDSPVFDHPLRLHRTTAIRAIARQGKHFSTTATQTYLVDEPQHGMPVISVTMSPSTLFHPKYGIMMDGPYINETLEHKPGANYWTRKEYLCNVEVFEDDKACVHNGLAGFRIFGGYSRVFPQKSFVLTSRKRYGSHHFDGDILPNAGVKKLKYLVLRNGGSDWNGAHLRDELMSSLIADWGVEKQGYRPAVVYLNGKYWGIYHIREKINSRFLADHKQVEQDSLDLLEHQNTVRSGTVNQYQSLVRYIETHDLSEPAHYQKVASAIDVDNFIDYQIAQFYCVNNDAGGNIRYWRPHMSGGKWRWIFFDMDWGFALHNPNAQKANSFQFFTEANGPTWPNPPWSTFLLRNLLKNETFKGRFINRMCDRIGTDFQTERVHKHLDQLTKQVAPDMPRHLNRWELSAKDWLKSVDAIRTFATERPYHLRSHMETFFDLGAQADLEVVSAEGGTVLVNGAIKVSQDVYQGHYYAHFPVELVAKPQSGYRFVGWDGWPDQKQTIFTKLQAGRTLRVRPRFEAYTHPLAGTIIFNEVSPFNKKTGDWIELYNTTKASLKLGAWRLSDGTGQDFTLPDVEIGPKGYIVICRNAQKFRLKHPLVTQPIVDGLSFGLDRAAESITLMTPEGDMIDSMSYRVEVPTTDYTIDLLLPSLDNANPRHWGAHLGLGSPALENPLLLSQLTGSQKDLWLRVGLGIGLLMLAMAAVWWKRSEAKG